MSPELWVYAGLGLLVAVHLALFAYAYRSRLPWGRGGSTAEGDPVGSNGGTEDVTGGGTDDATVRCRECGAENESDYRFCRRCVAELPGRATGGGGGGAPGSRKMF